MIFLVFICFFRDKIYDSAPLVEGKIEVFIQKIIKISCDIPYYFYINTSVFPSSGGAESNILSLKKQIKKDHKNISSYLKPYIGYFTLVKLPVPDTLDR